jgi:hypothetical protein
MIHQHHPSHARQFINLSFQTGSDIHADMHADMGTDMMNLNLGTDAGHATNSNLNDTNNINNNNNNNNISMFQGRKHDMSLNANSDYHIHHIASNLHEIAEGTEESFQDIEVDSTSAQGKYGYTCADNATNNQSTIQSDLQIAESVDSPHQQGVAGHDQTHENHYANQSNEYVQAEVEHDAEYQMDHYRSTYEAKGDDIVYNHHVVDQHDPNIEFDQSDNRTEEAEAGNLGQVQANGLLPQQQIIYLLASCLRLDLHGALQAKQSAKLNPFLVIWWKDCSSGQYIKVAETEPCWDDSSPVFSTPILLPYTQSQSYFQHLQAIKRHRNSANARAKTDSEREEEVSQNTFKFCAYSMPSPDPSGNGSDAGNANDDAAVSLIGTVKVLLNELVEEALSTGAGNYAQNTEQKSDSTEGRTAGFVYEADLLSVSGDASGVLTLRLFK